ncbi:unnamed protein product [Vitrella brassicaformis CCMP3155]|uniref:MORN repeat-containing protein 3 n=1 Tax=Vitrella brassicaformis (strain CCMP3155) TaxID=1169540 RepID=A0A0G4GNQ9_VITBC|nr:unnamed protein product [Vitrella brassicaformis CCMP3155]|eukprot:CEM31914.1 unnamed protein product [Vitrella brassicaformis CCMP3155]
MSRGGKKGPKATVYWVGTRKPNEEGVLVGEPLFTAEAYQGEWDDNRRHGYGVNLYRNNTKYEGQWQCNKRHGEGVLWRKKGKETEWRKVYTGGWQYDLRHGRGTQLYSNGDRYEGEWADNRRQGRGTMWYADGTVYEGEWHADERCGHGTLKLLNGDVYEGGWLKDDKEGPGAYFFFDTGRAFVGEWANGLPQAGAYSDAELSEGEVHPCELTKRPYPKELPPLQLMAPDDVMDACLKAVRTVQSPFRAKHLPLEILFSEDELDELHVTFDAVADGDTISVLDMRALYMAMGCPIDDAALTDRLALLGILLSPVQQDALHTAATQLPPAAPPPAPPAGDASPTASFVAPTPLVATATSAAPLRDIFGNPIEMPRISFETFARSVALAPPEEGVGVGVVGEGENGMGKVMGTMQMLKEAAVEE